MFITPQEIREFSSFNEVKALSDVQMTNYIERADSWISRATSSPALENTESPAVQRDMRIATWLLVEYLVYWDDPDLRESAMSQDDNVKIGSFSYSKKPDTDTYETGIKELDDILKTWKYSWNVDNFFKVSGPSRRT